jgi:hypothetical protein
VDLGGEFVDEARGFDVDRAAEDPHDVLQPRQ